MRRCAGCGVDFEESRPQTTSSADVKSVAALDDLPPGPLKSAISAPQLHATATDVPGGGWRSQAATFQTRRKTGFRPPRDCRMENLRSQTSLTSTYLQSQSLDPGLAESARARLLATKPRKPGSQPLLIAPGTSPYHAKALKLLEMSRSELTNIREEPESTPSMDSSRRARYRILPLQERSPKNRGTSTRFFASSLGTFPRQPSMSNQTLKPSARAGIDYNQPGMSNGFTSGYETYKGQCAMPAESRDAAVF